MRVCECVLAFVYKTLRQHRMPKAGDRRQPRRARSQGNGIRAIQPHVSYTTRSGGSGGRRRSGVVRERFMPELRDIAAVHVEMNEVESQHV